ncbi:MAG: oxidoreductase, partial [Caulobacteraceae bacterium]|nr:oxidoreductase [Caulobacteraceae bacterium]
MTPLALSFAGRELRSGLKGFRIFLACIAVGVTTIAAAGSTAEAFRLGLASQASEILGGDLSASLDQQRFTPAQKHDLEAAGRVAYADAVRAMAEGPDGRRRLVELRGVSAAYPLAGKVEITGAASLPEAFKGQGGVPGAVVEQSLIDNLGVRLGQTFKVGDTTLVAMAVLKAEPDRLSRGFALGPRVLTALPVLETGGFMAPGLPFTETARVALPAGGALRPAEQKLRQALGDGARLRDRNQASAGLEFLIDQLEYFLSFIGLASLIAGGLGVFGAVSAYLHTRQSSIAMLKALGASGALVRNIYLIQIVLLALLGVLIGLVIGALAPMALGLWVGKSLPVPALFGIYPAPLLRAGVFGVLAALAFSLAPLARARATSPASLLRKDLPLKMGLSLEAVGAALCAIGLAAMALVTAPTPLAAALMIAGVALAFGLLWLVGLLAVWLARPLRARARGVWRIGLANFTGPGSAARTAAPAIGLGVAFLSTIVLVQSSLLHEVRIAAPATAPSVVFTDIPSGQGPAFDAVVAKAIGRPLDPGLYLREPFTTGRVTAVNGNAIAPPDRGGGRGPRRPPGVRLDRDMQISVIDAQPPNAGIRSGAWWKGDGGAALAALDEDMARAGEVKLGDKITVSVLGRDVEAKVVVLRRADPGGFGASFPLVLSPSALSGVDLPQIAISRINKPQEDAVGRALAVAYPQVNLISVREQLEAASQIFDRVTLAVRAAASIASLSGVLVLAGAIAARAQARMKEAAILKVLGASRGQILSA